jgi:hypothetical protein
MVISHMLGRVKPLLDELYIDRLLTLILFQEQVSYCTNVLSAFMRG